MRIKQILVFAAVPVLLVVLFVVGDWWSHLPKPSFKRHFGSPIPKSVVITDKWGYTALAGSSEYIIFKIAPGDLEHIIASRGLKPMELMGSEAGFVGTNCMIDVSQLKRDIEIAQTHGVIPCKAFIDGKWDGLVYYLLLVGTNGTSVLWHYFKT